MAGEIFSKLITSVNPKIMNAGSRNGMKIDRIIIHHNATTNKDVAMNTWVKGGPAGTSAHYECTPDEIIGCVGEQYAAWHAGGTGGSDIPRISNPNQRSIGIENVNSSGAPNWSVDPRTIRNCAKLVADICKRYNIPLDRKHVLGHNEVTATACPGGINVDEVVRLAKEYAKGASDSNVAQEQKPSKPTTKTHDQIIAESKPKKVGRYVGKLEKFNEFKLGIFRIAGWLVPTEGAPALNYGFVFWKEAGTGKEIGRCPSKGIVRNDVNKAYGLPNGLKFGLDGTLDIKKFAGKKVYPCLRRTNDKAGNSIAGKANGNGWIDIEFPEYVLTIPKR